MNDTRHPLRTAVLLLAAVLALPAAAARDDNDRGVDSRAGEDMPRVTSAAEEAANAVAAARVTLADFLADPAQDWLRAHLGEARAVLIVPKLVRAGLLFFGGSGGRGVLLVRDPARGWSQPAFYLLGAANVGIEIGVQRAEAVLVATTDEGVEALKHGRLQLGAGASIAAGPIGGGGRVASADVLVFERAMGMFGGLGVEGTGIVFDAGRNRAFYGGAVDVEAITGGAVDANPAAQPLVDALNAAPRG